MKKVKIVYALVFQRQIAVYGFQRLAAVGVKIPEGVIKIEEKMPVFHLANYKKPVLQQKTKTGECLR